MPLFSDGGKSSISFAKTKTFCTFFYIFSYKPIILIFHIPKTGNKKESSTYLPNR